MIFSKNSKKSNETLDKNQNQEYNTIENHYSNFMKNNKKGRLYDFF